MNISATPSHLTTAMVSTHAASAAANDGDGLTGAAALNDGDSAAQAAKATVKRSSTPNAPVAQRLTPPAEAQAQAKAQTAAEPGSVDVRV